jgi:hypothetical protein
VDRIEAVKAIAQIDPDRARFVRSVTRTLYAAYMSEIAAIETPAIVAQSLIVASGGMRPPCSIVQIRTAR